MRSSSSNDSAVLTSLDKLIKEILVIGNLCDSFFAKKAEASKYEAMLNEKLKALHDRPKNNAKALIKKVQTIRSIIEIFKKHGKDHANYSQLIETLLAQASCPLLSLLEVIRDLYVSCLDDLKAGRDETENFTNLKDMTEVLIKYLSNAKHIDGEEKETLLGDIVEHMFNLVIYAGNDAEKSILHVRLARQLVAIYERVYKLMDKKKEDPLLSQLTLRNICYFNLQLAGGIINMVANREGEDEAPLTDAKKSLEAARQAISEIKLLPKIASKEMFSQTCNTFNSFQYPYLANIAFLKGNIENTKRFIALGETYCDYMDLPLVKFSALVNLHLCCMKIAKYYKDKNELGKALKWNDRAIDLCRRAEILGGAHTEIRNHNGADLLANAKSNLVSAMTELVELKKSLATANSTYIKKIALANKDIFNAFDFQESKNQPQLSVMIFDNARYAREVKKLFKLYCIDFTAFSENSIKVDLSSASEAHFQRVLESCIARCRKVSEMLSTLSLSNDAPNDQVSSSSAFSETCIVSKSKEEKLAAHERKERERKEEQDRKTAMVTSSDGKEKTALTKKEEKIKWHDDSNRNTNPKGYFRIYGSEGVVTFGKFSKKAFVGIDPLIAKRIKTVITRGNVIASDKTQGVQGICFNLTAKEQAKHKPPYVCKGKVVGSNGLGDYRPFAFKRATGTLFSQKPGQEKVKEKPCELIKFDWVNPHSHTRS